MVGFPLSLPDMVRFSCFENLSCQVEFYPLRNAMRKKMLRLAISEDVKSSMMCSMRQRGNGGLRGGWKVSRSMRISESEEVTHSLSLHLPYLR